MVLTTEIIHLFYKDTHIHTKLENFSVIIFSLHFMCKLTEVELRLELWVAVRIERGRRPFYCFIWFYRSLGTRKSSVDVLLRLLHVYGYKVHEDMIHWRLHWLVKFTNSANNIWTLVRLHIPHYKYMSMNLLFKELKEVEKCVNTGPVLLSF